MKNWLASALLAACLVVSLVQARALVPRGEDLPDRCNCDGEKYEKSDIEAAVDETLKLLKASKRIEQKSEGELTEWPHIFYNHEGLVSRAGQWWEFPLLRNTAFRSPSQKPGPARVLIDTLGRYAGVMVHPGGKRSFVPCKESLFRTTAPEVDDDGFQLVPAKNKKNKKDKNGGAATW